MAFVQLNPTIPLIVAGKGKGHAIAVIDYGEEHNLVWVTAIDENGEIWCVPNALVRLRANWTLGRSAPNFAGDTGQGDAAPLAAAARKARPEGL